MKKLISAAIVCAVMTPLVQADQVILDDLIVTGSQCVGLDCVNGEDFEFDTLRLRENNLRIRFDDTSTSSSFPKNDWQITANDSANGGQSYIAIEDITKGSTPFKVMAGAADASLFVGENGFIGLGTATPAQQLHIVSGNTPSVRLEQTGTGGFNPIAWDISANGTGLTIATGGATIFTLEADGDLTITGNLTSGTPAASFPDYVFSPTYSLMPLDQLQNYVSANSHLPGIPAADEVAGSGINMTELQVNLLKKVEELTLYTLQQQAQIAELQQLIQASNGQN